MPKKAQPKDQLLSDLLALKSVFEKHAWTTGRWGGPRSAMCMEGGIARVMTTRKDIEDLSEAMKMDLLQIRADYGLIGNNRHIPRVNCLMTAIEQAVGARPGDIPLWNDVSYRTKEDVLEAIGKAINNRIEQVTLWEAQQAAEKDLIAAE